MSGEGGSGIPPRDGPRHDIGFRFDRDEVLVAHRLFQRALDRLSPFVEDMNHRLQIQSMASDDVSMDAARVLNERLMPARAALSQYRDRIDEITSGLTEISTRYRQADEDNAGGFSGGGG
ncbi:hypothetical protein LX15_005503 [Streptoalloteichus tenebrarius]|uniref:PE domain-containing protein n=1 Tax=Streptoalloteichus tenebrarius (strain ATCC 17920 / DSM 40477 / JCM 4838 / CBS 697.72 / NBRC 16177 / NCIMB 11028 / NRRL B-12390 / A12253. 1 / ISP 5477) TaxID=1933 RepID=A0ABT1I1W3_STRSD|nr:hypothetical protein [Streptoalloteichus tenebrarius]MCP2261777.1 hypothetical protein [Streptoalloteichus tenebrarius]BFF00834.1 hypothetical protein GCM10020241_25090 [Streptoalloteichus tenebrarius]